MKTKYVCHGIVKRHVNFHGTRTNWTVTSSIKICRWGGEGKRAHKMIFFYNKIRLILKERALFPFPPNCKFLHVDLLTTLSDYYENLHIDL